MTKSVNEFARFLPVGHRRGFQVTRLPKSGVVLIELDYFTDPLKERPEWIAEERRTMPPKQWSVEMDRSWEVSAGKPIYDRAFFKHQHVLVDPIEVNANYPIFRGWDFGGNQSVAICQVIGTRLIVLDEMPNMGLNTRAFAPEVIAYCNNQYGPNFHYIDIVDPSAAWEGKTASGKACTDIMREFGLSPIAASTNDPEKRISAVTRLLMTNNAEDGYANLRINPGCKMLIDGFLFGYHYPEKPTQSQRQNRPVKNLYSHIHDALQYVSLRMVQHHEDLSEELDYEKSLTARKYRFT